MEIKELLLKNIPENKFFDICNFVEELYLMEYDLLILMARKFFNLFCVFNEINCQKYERLRIPYKHDRKIITNRALPLVRNDLENHALKKVIIADDIIIHGRSIREVHNELLELCPELDVLLISYVRNDQGVSAYEDIKGKIQSRYFMEPHEWRELSDEIVKIFYLSGRPYISYLPYFSLNVEWEELKDKFQKEDCWSIQNEDMKIYGIEAYMYGGEKISIFQNLKWCKICVIRFYYYSQIHKVIMIPYFCMDVAEEDKLDELSDFIRSTYFTRQYRELVKKNNNVNEMRIMELEYVLSVWMGMWLLDVLKIKTHMWHREIESYNFSEKLLPEIMLSGKEINEKIDKIKKIGGKLCLKKPVMNSEVQILVKKYEELKEIYKNNLLRWNTMKQWKENLTDFKQRFIDNYLAINGNVDEERCKDGNVEKKRLFGVPVSYILEDMSEFLYELDGRKGEKSDYIKRVFAAILVAVDSGRGTIVTKIVEENSQSRYDESVIYAGEQNYKFYENTNFPIIYGLYLVEQETMRQNSSEKISERKKMLVDRFAKFLEKEQIFYIKEEMLQISEWNISDDFEKFLQNSYEKYCGNFVLNKAVTMALDICNFAV